MEFSDFEKIFDTSNLNVPIKQMEVPGIVFSMAFDWTGDFLFLGAVETILVTKFYLKNIYQ
jgi:hypothetical protein